MEFFRRLRYIEHAPILKFVGHFYSLTDLSWICLMTFFLEIGLRIWNNHRTGISCSDIDFFIWPYCIYVILAWKECNIECYNRLNHFDILSLSSLTYRNRILSSFARTHVTDEPCLFLQMTFHQDNRRYVMTFLKISYKIFVLTIRRFR